jgi:hypothetical protein
MNAAQPNDEGPLSSGLRFQRRCRVILQNSSRSAKARECIPQRIEIAAVIDELLLIWSASDSDEWTNLILYLPL